MPPPSLQAIRKHRATNMVLVLTMIRLATDQPDAGQYDLSSVQAVAYGGLVISEAVLQRAMMRFPSAGFHQD